MNQMDDFDSQSVETHSLSKRFHVDHVQDSGDMRLSVAEMVRSVEARITIAASQSVARKKKTYTSRIKAIDGDQLGTLCSIITQNGEQKLRSNTCSEMFILCDKERIADVPIVCKTSGAPYTDSRIVYNNNADVTLRVAENGKYDIKHKEQKIKRLHKHQLSIETTQASQENNNENWRYKSQFLDNSYLVEIEIDPSSNFDPHQYWESVMKDQVGPVEEIIPLNPGSEIGHNCIRFVCMSDTHGRIGSLKIHDFLSRIPAGDVLLHTGDFTLLGDDLQEYEEFNHLLSLLPHKLKLVIPGNHEIYLDPRLYTSDDPLLRKNLGMPLIPSSDDPTEHIEHLRSVLCNAKVLIDNLVEFCGIKIYGLPWIPKYGVIGFGLKRGYRLLEKYNQIPAGTDILMSHGPALGFCDLTHRELHVGCAELLNSVRKRIKPRYVVHGHIHEAYGIQSDGQTTFINAALCNKQYDLVNDPIVFDFPLPHPFTRAAFLKLNLEDLQLSTSTSGNSS